MADIYNIKINVDTELMKIAGVTVSGNFPKANAKMPHINFGVGNNADPMLANSNRGILQDLDIFIDVWHNKATDTLADSVDDKMTGLGFRRSFAADLNDPSGLNRKTMRYRGVLDTRSMRVHQ